jgi:PAS domain-containing protein
MSDKQDIQASIDKLIGFEFIFQISRQPIFIVSYDKEAHLVEMRMMNQSAFELIKSAPDELANINPYEIGLFSSEEELIRQAENENNTEGVSYIAKIITETDQEISSEITLYRKQYQHIVYLIALQRNLGNTNKMLEALRHSEFRFLQMAENITEGIIIAEEGKTVFINSSICHITGYSKDQLRDLDETGWPVKMKKSA